jgi:hypothetical protein
MINHIILWLLGMLNLIYSIVMLLNNKNIYYKYIDDKDKFILVLKLEQCFALFSQLFQQFYFLLFIQI